MLIRGDTLVRWRGEPISGLWHPLNIEELWTPTELAAVGLHRISHFVVPSGKRIVAGAVPTYTIDSASLLAIEAIAVEDIPPPTAEEVRDAEVAVDPDRLDLIDRIGTATAAQIKTYVQNNVTDLVSAKILLAKILLLLSIVARRM